MVSGTVSRGQVTFPNYEPDVIVSNVVSSWAALSDQIPLLVPFKPVPLVGACLQLAKIQSQFARG